uniref:BAT2_N domain-containing protein n=1 Tax=Syphacia muris TaxID=451379 RepID=A0A158R435_9BILA
MSSRGAAGATKPKLHNVNSIYAGKNHSVVKAPGLGKHGLQSLGKTTAVVRRMPPPATLPSLRAESQGQDPNVALVPQGGTGWNKAATVENTILSDSSSTAKTSGTVSGSGINIVGPQGIGQHTTDLRPTWAKPANSMDANAAATQNSTSVTASVRDFPSLAAATASSGKQSSVLLNDSLKPQKSGSWRSGGGSAQSRNDNEDVASQQLRSAGNTLFSSAQSRNTERQLPSRYYGGTEAYSPPTGTYQIPKQIPANVITSAGSHTNSETRYTAQAYIVEDTAIRVSQSVTAPTASNNTIVFPTNVAVPPPNYSQPPPNFQSLQARKTIYTTPPQVTQTSAESGKVKVEESQEAQQRNGRGDVGCKEGTNIVPVTIADNNKQTAPVSTQADNLEGLSRDESDMNKNDWRKDVRGHSITGILQRNRHIPNNDHHSRLMNDVDWPSSQYGYMDREAESRRWRSAGGGGQNSDNINSESPQFPYGREYEEDFGRRENVEREAAIERSRRKRRTANQNSMASESESGASSVYGSSRTNTGFNNDVYPDWERPQSNNYSQFSRESVTYAEKNNDHVQHWGLRYEESDFDDSKQEVKEHNEADVTAQPEYKVLRRPESRESAELSQQVSQVSLQDDVEDEEYELQLTKLAHAPAKVVKRVAPNVGSLQQTDSVKANTNQEINNSLPQAASVTVSTQRMQSRPSSDKRKTEVLGKCQESFTEASIQRTGDRDRKARTLKEDRSREDANTASVKQLNPPAIVAAPLPTDNVWEKRAEEREVAQRAAKKDFIDTAHFPAFNEETMTAPSQDQLLYFFTTENWAENTYSGNYSHFDSGDFYGQDDEEDSGQLFRGQREFVNSRVSAHHRLRGGLTIGGRDSKGRIAATSLRRGSGVSHQTNIRGRRAQGHHSERAERFNQRRSKRQEEHIPEQEDNFANMGEFRVEDAYPSLASIDEKISTEEGKKDDTLEVGRKSNGDRHGNRVQKNHNQRSQQQQQYRATQQYYQPRQQNDDYNSRSGARGNNRTRGSMRRAEPYVSGNNQNFAERGKRKKEFSNKRDEASFESFYEHDKIGNDENVGAVRDDVVKEAKKNLTQQARFRRNSLTHRDGSPIRQSQASLDRLPHVKSPVTSEGQEEWETASESSDVAERQKFVLSTCSWNSCSTNYIFWRVTFNFLAQRRENVNESATSRSTHSKNAKPASTTLHTAGRGGQSRNQEIVQVTNSEPRRRDGACRDGLAGLDINDAGVVVIDDLRDVCNTSGDLAEDGDDDFEEVISKKNKRIRQQQINEQLEAAFLFKERRKQKEKEREKRKVRQQAKKMEKKTVVVKDSKMSNGNGGSVGRMASESQGSNGVTATVPKGTPVMLNTTVWNSSIIKEQGLSPLDNFSHPVIPSPIARPVHKTGVSSNSSSTNISNSKKAVEPWTRPDEEQRQTLSKKVKLCNLDDSAPSVKKTTVEFTANFNSPPTRPESQYDFTFDPSLQDDSQPLSPKNSTKNINVAGHHVENNSLKTLTVEQNDDERLKERLDKVKDFWPGQQFTNSLLENAVGSNSISHLNEKPQSSPAGTGSLHGSNVAKVRPQPQTNDACGSVPLKDSVSTSSAASVLPPPSPVACIPQGTYLQSLAQVPPPHYSMIFGEPFSLHSAISPPAQAVFNGGVSTSQGPISRSRPASFIEHSHLFVHPPPAGNASSSLTWSNPAPQLEILSGLNPTSSLSSQSRPTSVQRFQFPSQGPSGSTFGTPPPVINGAAKLSHIAPPSHSHQVPPPLHPPRNFMPHPPPHEFFSHQGSTLGPVGSQRGTDISNQAATTGGLTRGNVGMLGQVPPPHMQHINFQPQSPSAFGLPGATAFNQVPPMHPFSAPPPLRFPSVQTVGSDVNGVTAATWGKATLPSVSMKFATGACTPNVVTLERNPGRNPGERWTMPTSLPQQFQNPFMFQQHAFGKEGNEGIQTNGERYSAQCPAETRRETNEERASTASSMSTNGNETVESSKKTATKV